MIYLIIPSYLFILAIKGFVFVYITLTRCRLKTMYSISYKQQGWIKFSYI